MTLLTIRKFVPKCYRAVVTRSAAHTVTRRLMHDRDRDVHLSSRIVMTRITVKTCVFCMAEIARDRRPRRLDVICLALLVARKAARRHKAAGLTLRRGVALVTSCVSGRAVGHGKVYAPAGAFVTGCAALRCVDIVIERYPEAATGRHFGMALSAVAKIGRSECTSAVMTRCTGVCGIRMHRGTYLDRSRI